MSLFDGVTGLFEGVFDEPVTLLRDAQPDLPLRGIFREEPVERTDGDGNDVTVVAPVIKMRAADATYLARGARLTVQSRPGETFVVTAKLPTRSPASDRHFLILLTRDEDP